MTDKEINQLRIQLRGELTRLNPSIYPYFGSLAKTADGLNKAEEMVLGYAATQRVEPMTAIALLESEYGND